MALLATLLGYSGQTRYQTGFTSISHELAEIFGAGRYGNDSGVDVDDDGAMRLSVYWACVRVISEDVAKRPFKVYRKRAGNGRDELSDHPVYRVLQEQFHDDLDSFTGRQLLTQWATSWGNGYAQISQALSGSIELYPIHPSRVQIIYTKEGDKRYRVHANDRGLDTVEFSPRAILHVRGLGDEDEGWSVAKFAAQSIGLALAAERYGAKYFRNNARPSIVLETDKKFKDHEAIKAFRQSWSEVYANAELGGTAVAEDGLKVKVIGVPNEDAQFIETRDHQDVDVTHWFRMKPHKVGLLQDQHRSNIEQESLDYYSDVIMPWDVRWEKQIKLKLLYDEPGVYAEHDVRALLRGDTAARSQWYRERFNIASMTVNEIRDLENENPVEGGDKRYIQTNMAEIDEDGNVKPLKTAGDGPDADAVRSAILDGHASALSQVIARMDRVASNAKAAATKKGLTPEAFAAWRADFHEKHTSNVMTAFMPIVESLCRSCLMLVQKLPDDIEAAIHECTKLAVDLYMEHRIEYGDAVAQVIVSRTLDRFSGGAGNETQLVPVG